ncbi:MAG: ATPase [Tenericutes bacterium HGW-Tenericutes-1]|jgi:hypothetical protein|nr:MAG: ATPase [Tenericutes bacterium HGW-Tenericutes-1]
MAMIERESYFELLNGYKNKPFIKVLTGLRRVGKSTLITLFIENLLNQGVHQSNILKINFELPNTFEIEDYKSLTNYILQWAKDKNDTLYVFLDEIGRVKDWEKAVNALHALEQFDLYITGSNADMLSSELSTFLAGRYIEILIHPFSYKEFKLLYPQAGFNDFLIFGGIPSIHSLNLNYDFSMNALRDSFRSAVLQNVISRYQIRNAYVLEKLIEYVFTNVGKTFSALSIAKYFKSQKITISVDTILSYLNMIQEAFLIYKVSRNDLIGKNVLKTEEKYYIADHGIREAIAGNNMKVIEAVLENIVYIELIRRGYLVYVGKVNDKEIDFVAYKGNQRNYYQVSYLMETESTRDREFGIFDQIKDNYPKYVISMDKVNFSQNGVIHLNIEDFLLL